MSAKTHVVVIGGGYAGVIAANRLTQSDEVAVTLINPRPTFVERLRLHQLVTGSDDAVEDYREVLAQGVRLVVDTATRIDAGECKVALKTGLKIDYDYLIYAVGSRSAALSIPGASMFAHPIVTLEEAESARRVLEAAPPSAFVTVVGAGVTGIETAAELAETGRRVTLVCGDVLGPYLHPRGRRSVAKRLAKLRVTVIEGVGARATAVTSEAVKLSSGRSLQSDVTIWTAGFGVPDLAAMSGLTTDADGRLLTDETLTSVDDERIVAAGDSASPADLPLRMSCYSAQPLGAHAADTVLARVASREPTPMSLGFYGLCISLGRGGATAQIAGKDDVAKAFYIGGRLGAGIKEGGTKGVLKRLKDEARKPGSLSWPQGISRPRAQPDRTDAAGRGT